MDTPFDTIRGDARYRLVADLAELFGVQAFLVGGGLRDAVMGRAVRDFDFVLGGAEEDLPRELAHRIGGRFFWLDRERRQARVVTSAEDGRFTLDFAPIRGENLGEDLALRDFTMNSLALPVAKSCPPLVDPLQGMTDIAEGRIRACSERTFQDDPLRLLRAVRFAATLGFQIDGGTWRELVKRPQLLAGVAGERVRDEFFLILDTPAGAPSLEMLRDSGLLDHVFPLGSRMPESSADCGARIHRVEGVERVMADLPVHFPGHAQELAGHLLRRIEGGITRAALVKLAAFLAGEDAEKRIELCCDRLRLGGKAGAELQSLCRCCLSFPPWVTESPGGRVLFRFFRDRAPAGPELLLLPLVNNAVSPESAVRLVSFFFREYRPSDRELLLSGAQVMEVLGIGQGPELGGMLEALREAESLGHVSTEAEAREFILKNRLTKQGPVG